MGGIMEYIKQHTSEKKDVHILHVSYDFRDEWNYQSEDIEMPGYFQEEVLEAISKIREICEITKKGQEACKQAFNSEDSVIITLKNGLSFSFELMSSNGKHYPLIDIDQYKKLTYFDQNGDEFKVNGW